MLEDLLLPIDKALSERLLVNSDNKKAFDFLCFLSKASREGHLCVKIDENEVLPDPELLISVSSDNIREGFASLPPSIISNTSPSTPLHQDGNCIYFQKNWLYECSFKMHLDRLLQSTPEIHLSEAIIKEESLLPEQSLAIEKALKNTLTIISGGPGTGKTYTAGLIIKTLWKTLSEEQKASTHIVLAAPTGKAASNLQKSILKATENISDFPSLHAQTIHSLLGKKASYLRADFILIDESSMIDASMMSRLLASVKSGARLIFLGDPYQLPPVESGALFSEMNSLLKENGVELRQCMRSDLQGILGFASLVKQGDSLSALKLLEEGQSGIHLFKTSSSFKKELLDYVQNRFPSPKSEPSIESFNQFRLLSPLRKGFYGVDEINHLLLDFYRAQIRPHQTFVAPIMLTSNDYRLELFNGEVGVLVTPPSGEEYLLIQSSKGTRKIPTILVPKYEYAYCLSVHKSQGSEFDSVLALFPEGSEIFGREVLYTAATRARKLLEIWGAPETLRKTIDRKVNRISGVRDRKEINSTVLEGKIDSSIEDFSSGV